MRLTKFLNIFIVLNIVFATLFAYRAALQYQPSTIYPEYVHKTLYVDRSFNNTEIELIVEASWEWAIATDQRVIYDIVVLPTEHIPVQNSIILNKINEDNIMIVLLDHDNKNITLGYYDDRMGIPYIGIVLGRIRTYKEFKTVILHELGHSLGLPHNESDEGMHTLMYPLVNFESDYITKIDADNYCKIHHCRLKN